ncbi:MAG TPA: hypothetical protein VEB19_04535 [Gemmatimonadaceae bacterium]|nr:hypothetical protein [Gemmatimonadaceae bacterium]
MRTPLVRRAAVVLAAFSLGCGDSTGPNLSEAQVSDMLDAMSAVSALAVVPIPGADLSRATMTRAALRAANTPMANATVTVSETVDCPLGGSATVNGTVNSDEEAGTVAATVTHVYSDCAAVSSEDRVWTFNGNPQIVTNLNATSNEAAETFSMTMTQVGGIRFSSDLGEGSCQINLTMTMTGTAQSLSLSLNGSACGRNIQQSVQVTQ